ncbi:hypothetical protein A134_23170 [Vibrio crassostreae 9CS106]|uniref:Uncharacterized protein n=1 Tax=Vibrio crassostreae 9CS106 TaxID=1191300 RepID=A0A1B1C384_9VIBR|nr:hypothetical protein A134_23170 [Vibrio crassostreae 9CS106]
MAKWVRVRPAFLNTDSLRVDSVVDGSNIVADSDIYSPEIYPRKQPITTDSKVGYMPITDDDKFNTNSFTWKDSEPPYIPPTFVEGTVKFGEIPASRMVLAFSLTKRDIPNSDDGSGNKIKYFDVVGVDQSDDDGDFRMDTDGYQGDVVVVSIDNYGRAWEAEKTYRLREFITPVQWNGYVYEVISGGKTGLEEPDWNLKEGGNTISGTVTFVTRLYYRPIAHAPIQTVVVDA